jgi:hypothetical protein
MSDGEWPAVGAEIRERVAARKMRAAELARIMAPTETTIRSVRKGASPYEALLPVMREARQVGGQADTERTTAVPTSSEADR